MKIIPLVLISAILLGCGSTPKPHIIYETKTVYKSTYQIPKFDIPERPEIPVEKLSEKDAGDHNTIGKAYVKSVTILEGYTDRLTNILIGIKKGENQN